VLRRRTGLLLTLLTAGTLAVAGCSGDSAPTAGSDAPPSVASAASSAPEATGEPAAEVLRRAALKSEEAGSARVSFETTSGSAAAVSGTGVYSFTPPVRGSIDFSSFAAEGQTLPGGMTILMTPDAYYLRIPALEGQLGKPWVKLSLAAIAEQSGVDLSQLTRQAQQGNPMAYLELLQSRGDLEVMGEETVSGIQTTHYQGSIDYTASLDQLSPELRAQLEQQLAQTGMETAKVDVWVDADGMVRQLAQESESPIGPMSVTMRIEEYGVPVDVTPPADEDTVDIRELTGF
jgi:hypothetical protein